MKPLLFQYYGNYSITAHLIGQSLVLDCNDGCGVFYRSNKSWQYQSLDGNRKYLADLSGDHDGLTIQLDGKKASFIINQKSYEIWMGNLLDFDFLDFMQVDGSSFIIFRDLFKYIKVDDNNPVKLHIWEFKSDGAVVKYVMPSPALSYHIQISKQGLNLWTPGSSTHGESKRHCYHLSLKPTVQLFNIPILPRYDQLTVKWKKDFNYQNQTFTIPIEFRKLGNIGTDTIAQVVVKCMKSPNLLPYIPIDDYKKQDFGEFKVLFSYSEYDNKTNMYMSEQQAAEEYLNSSEFEKIIDQSLNLYLSGGLSNQFFIELDKQ